MLPGSAAKRSDWGAVLCLALVALLPPPHGAAATPAGADCNCPQRFSVGLGAPKGDCSCSFCPYDPKTSYSPHPGYSLRVFCPLPAHLRARNVQQPPHRGRLRAGACGSWHCHAIVHRVARPLTIIASGMEREGKPPRED